MTLPSASPTLLRSLPRRLSPFVRNPSVMIGGGLVLAIAVMALLAPLLATVDPVRIDPSMRLKPPSLAAWFGTDLFGRDVYSRAIYGARSSVLIGMSVAGFALAAGVLIGLLAGYFRLVDLIVMRVMDGLMAIRPSFWRSRWFHSPAPVSER